MSLNDKGLIVAHWADEASRAEGTDASEARAHADQDLEAAISRAEAATAGRPGVMRRIVNLLRPRGR